MASLELVEDRSNVGHDTWPQKEMLNEPVSQSQLTTMPVAALIASGWCILRNKSNEFTTR
jgi:hypothetical protein